MSAERTDFVTVIPINSLKTTLEFVKGNHVSASDLALAADNVFSYALGQFMPANIPMFAAQVKAMKAEPPPTQAEAEAAIMAVMAPQAGASAGPVGKLDWQTILKTLLPFLLGLL